MQNNPVTQVGRHDELNHQAKCVLTIQAPRQRCEKFKNILNPVLRQFDPSSFCIHISEDETLVRSLPPDQVGQHGSGVPRYQDNKNILSTPALAVMLFLQERGTSAQDVQKYFKQYPWRIHHKIELQNKRSPTVRVGQQEYYSLSREYPLWSVCPVYAGFEHLRLTLFVSRFSEMVEFYRLITDSEMESTKPDFCLFPMCSGEGNQVILCLKRCRQLRPFPLTCAYLSFKVRNILTLRSLLRGELREIARNKYLIKDPDGNLVMLEDMNITSPNSVEYENCVTSRIADVSCDVTSVKSVCGSHDSGRYSDSDQCASELDHKSLKKSVHFSDMQYVKTSGYHTTPATAEKDGKSTHINPVKSPNDENNTQQSESELSFDDYYDEYSQRCYPGMVIAHARLRESQSEQTARDDSRQLTIVNGHAQQHEQTGAKHPIVTVTDCSGNIHNCIERVIYPSEYYADQSVPYDPGHGQLGTYDSTGQLEIVGNVFQQKFDESIPNRRPNIETDWGRHQNGGQNCDLDRGQVICRTNDDRDSRPEVMECGCFSDGLSFPSVTCGREDCVREKKFREEVNMKRLVKPVYI